MAKSPPVRLEVRYRSTGMGGPSDDEGAWTLKSFPVTSQITLRELSRGVDYEVEARYIGANGLPSTWAPVTVTVPGTAATPPSQQVRELDISSGAIELNCAFRNFRLTLSANVTTVTFTNVPTACTLTLEIEQWSGGGNTIAYPPSVSPISGVPHAMSAAAASVDIVTFQTTNGGITWYQTVFQAVVAFAGTIAPSPATDSSSTDGVTPSAPSILCTMTTANGTAPITYAWTRDDTGGTDFLIDNAAIAAPTFSIATGTTAFNATQRWRCTATDTNGLVCQALVNVTLARTVTGGLGVSLSPSPASDTVTAPEYPTASVTATVSGATGTVTYAWTRIDANGGSNFGGQGNAVRNFTRNSGTVFLITQTWRCTVTDDNGSSFSDVDVTLERDT